MALHLDEIAKKLAEPEYEFCKKFMDELNEILEKMDLNAKASFIRYGKDNENERKECLEMWNAPLKKELRITCHALEEADPQAIFVKYDESKRRFFMDERSIETYKKGGYPKSVNGHKYIQKRIVKKHEDFER